MYLLDEDVLEDFTKPFQKQLDKVKMDFYHELQFTFKHEFGGFCSQWKVSIRGYHIQDDPEKRDPHQLAYFYLQSYPSNCGMVILHNFYCWSGLRGKGVVPLMFNFLNDVVEEMGYTSMQCTAQVVRQARFIKLAKQNGFSEIDRFTNKRSENEIAVLSKQFN